MTGGSLYFCPASIVQRFKAGILDIGLLLSALIALAALYYAVSGLPEGGIRYVPPHPEMGLWRVVRPLVLFTIAALWLAAFLSSKWRATPGMMAMQIRADLRRGGRIGFGRALGWVFAAWAPLLIATELVLTGFHLRTPLLHAGRLNLFSLLIIVQCLWFSAMLMRRDRRTIHDLIGGISITHYADRRPGLALFLVSAPFYAFIGLILGGLMFVSAVNLFDAPVHPRLAALRADMPQTSRSLYDSWRGDPANALHEPPPDFRCAARPARFRSGYACPGPAVAASLYAGDAARVEAYRKALASPASGPMPREYLKPESQRLTDAFLSGIIGRLNANPPDDTAFDEWLLMTARWRAELYTSSFLHAKASALMNYNRILSALPIILDARPALLEARRTEISNAIAPIALEDIPLNALLAHEFRFFDGILDNAGIDYFPFAQPAHTRNQYVYAAEQVENLFQSSNIGEDFRRAGAWFAPAGGLSLYNPLGMRFRDLALANLSSNLHVATTYHHNNALKKMLALYVAGLERGVPPAGMGAFLAALPDEARIVLGESPVEFDPARQVLYYEVPGLAGFRRELPI